MRELTWTVVGDAPRASTAGPRLGVLSVPGGVDGRDEPVRIATPACLTYTRRGEPAHLTPDVLATLPPEARAFQVCLVHFMDHLPPTHVSNCPGGGRAYFGSAPTFALATARDAITFDQHAKPSNDASATYVGTPVGAKKVSVEEYMRWVFATRPHAFVQLADEQHSVEGVNAKKTRAAAERTANWLDACAAANETDEKNANPGTPPVAMFASVQGGCDVEARRLSAKAAASRCLGFELSTNAPSSPPASNETNAKKQTSRRDPVFGFSIGGLGTGEAPGAARAKLVAACVAELPREKPVHVAGVGAPLDLIAMIENGVDLMDNAFAHVMTLAGRALRFPVDAKDVEEKGKDAKTRTGASKKRRRDDADDDETQRDSSLFSGSDAFSLNLWSLKYRTDTRPLLENCACHTCAHHTRAYVHHLLQCREMTASVLLDAHNQFHFLRFFAAAREAIANDAFAAFAAFHRNRAKEETEAGESDER